ncbi:odorant receptor Or1-like [Zophobas morio]|uniref:odorant receptor Or1-like n=1 Tax=Zophobas morio TaxID=2755281 RepID=UPI003082F6CE
MTTIIWQSFSINIYIMRAFGLYPPEKPTRKSRILNFIFGEEIDQMRIGDNGFLVAETACQITKLMPFVMNGSRIKRCIHYLEDFSFEVKEDKEKFLEKWVKTCQRNSKVFLGSIIAGNVSWAVKPFLVQERQLPVDVWLPFNLMENNIVYFLVFALLTLGVGYVSIASAAIDPLIGGLCGLASGHIQVLKNNLQYLNQCTADSESLKIFITRRNVKDCINHHNIILNFVKEYECCFSSIVFSQFAGSVVVVCFCCLQLGKIPPMTLNFFIMVSYLTILLVQIYFYCYYGTILYEESNSIINAVYMGNWYDYDAESKRDLILLMERSQRPIVVTAGKILDLSVTTFTTILRRSYSLLAVLKNQ